MNFLSMYTELSDRTGAFDSAVSGDLTKLKRWLNLAQQDITGRHNWEFMTAHETIQGVADITTGTVDISVDSTSLTFSSAPSASVAGYFIKFSDTNNWYKISSHTAASTSATLSQAFGGDSNISAGTYTLRKLWYTTSTPLDSILDIKETVNGRFLESANSRDTDIFLSLYWDQGTSYNYVTSVSDSTGGIQISFIYSPSERTNFQVRGVKKLTDMSSDSDTSIIPARWHSTVLDMASFYAFSALDDTRAKDFFAAAEIGIKDMARVYGQDLGRHRVMGSPSVGYGSTNGYTLPPQYGVVV